MFLAFSENFEIQIYCVFVGIIETTNKEKWIFIRQQSKVSLIFLFLVSEVLSKNNFQECSRWAQKDLKFVVWQPPSIKRHGIFFPSVFGWNVLGPITRS